jgi:putative pyruvate formate lyase activating enzyme
MTQYTPVNPAGSGVSDIPNRHISEAEHQTVTGWLEEFEIDDGFYQELVLDRDWLPDFNRQNPFSSELSEPVWHWREGFVSP